MRFSAKNKILNLQDLLQYFFHLGYSDIGAINLPPFIGLTKINNHSYWYLKYKFGHKCIPMTR